MESSLVHCVATAAIVPKVRENQGHRADAGWMSQSVGKISNRQCSL
jgi:hypothetical protein